MHHIVDAYIHTLFSQGMGKWIPVGSGEERMEYAVNWNEETAGEMARECAALVETLTRLGSFLDRQLREADGLRVNDWVFWNTWLRPFPDHGLDRDALRHIWERELAGEPLRPEEQKLSGLYDSWYEACALQRLPWLRCAPTALMCRARRYARLVQLQAPKLVREQEALRLAEEFVRYHLEQ